MYESYSMTGSLQKLNIAVVISTAYLVKISVKHASVTNDESEKIFLIRSNFVWIFISHEKKYILLDYKLNIHLEFEKNGKNKTSKK